MTHWSVIFGGGVVFQEDGDWPNQIENAKVQCCLCGCWRQSVVNIIIEVVSQKIETKRESFREYLFRPICQVFGIYGDLLS